MVGVKKNTLGGQNDFRWLRDQCDEAGCVVAVLQRGARGPAAEGKGAAGIVTGKTNTLSGWWFQIFFIFAPTWGNDPIWKIFFKWVETTNLLWSRRINPWFPWIRPAIKALFLRGVCYGGVGWLQPWGYGELPPTIGKERCEATYPGCVSISAS